VDGGVIRGIGRFIVNVSQPLGCTVTGDDGVDAGNSVEHTDLTNDTLGVAVLLGDCGSRRCWRGGRGEGTVGARTVRYPVAALGLGGGTVGENRLDDVHLLHEVLPCPDGLEWTKEGGPGVEDELHAGAPFDSAVGLRAGGHFLVEAGGEVGLDYHLLPGLAV